jgi:hypothetical protein
MGIIWADGFKGIKSKGINLNHMMNVPLDSGMELIQAIYKLTWYLMASINTIAQKNVIGMVFQGSKGED